MATVGQAKASIDSFFSPVEHFKVNNRRVVEIAAAIFGYNGVDMYNLHSDPIVGPILKQAGFDPRENATAIVDNNRALLIVMSDPL